MYALARMIASSDPLRFLLAVIALAIAALLLMALIGVLDIAGSRIIAAMREIDRKRNGHPPEAAMRPRLIPAEPLTWSEYQAEERRFMAEEAAKAAANERTDWTWRQAAAS